MSVRDFSNQPCGVCKSDTLHYQMRCHTCGTSQPHPYEVFDKSTEKHDFKFTIGMDPELRQKLSDAKGKRLERTSLRHEVKVKERKRANAAYKGSFRASRTADNKGRFSESQ